VQTCRPTLSRGLGLAVDKYRAKETKDGNVRDMLQLGVEAGYRQWAKVEQLVLSKHMNLSLDGRGSARWTHGTCQQQSPPLPAR
jgi:hypothetical protein